MQITKQFVLYFLMALILLPAGIIASPTREYERGYTKEEKRIITWIIKTIAWDNLVKLAKKKGDLKEEGKKVNSLHPLRFCEVIFSDEELKCGAHAIRERTGWVRDPFYNGITETLEEEYTCNNLKIEYIQDFAKNVKIDYGLILPLLQKKRWVDFVNCLIDNIPREKDPHRYNM